VRIGKLVRYRPEDVRSWLEQQAEIVLHAFLMRSGARVEGKPPLGVYEGLLPF